MKALKRRLQAKQTVIGSWLSFNYTATAEIVSKAGFEFVVVDMEHPATGTEGAWQLIQIIELCGSVPLVRVGANDPLLIKHALDSGAHGVVVPMVNTVEDAKRAIQAAYYPPVGTRGVGLWRAQGYGAGFEAYKSRAIHETIVVAQIEHYLAVENLDLILDLDGIDAFIVGPYDLSGSVGDPGNFRNPRFLACLEKVQRVLQNHAKPGGFHLVHPSLCGGELQEKVRMGARFLVYGADEVFFSSTIAEHVAHLRELELLSK